MKSSLLALAALSILGTASLRADTYEIDPVHSSVLFKVSHMGLADFYGRFNDIAGTVNFDAANPAQSTMAIEIKTESVDTHNEKRNQHLRTPDFFSVKEFPTITFKSTKVVPKGDKSFDVTGDLTMHGVTKSIAFTLNRGGEGKGMQGEHRAGAGAELVLKRSDFGMKFMPDALGDDVGILLSLEGVKK